MNDDQRLHVMETVLPGGNRDASDAPPADYPHRRRTAALDAAGRAGWNLDELHDLLPTGEFAAARCIGLVPRREGTQVC
jgi:hypothetical protein